MTIYVLRHPRRHKRLFQRDGWPLGASRVYIQVEELCKIINRDLVKYSDLTTSRTLNVAATSDVNNMTIEECITFCTPAGYQFAGVEFGRVRPFLSKV